MIIALTPAGGLRRFALALVLGIAAASAVPGQPRAMQLAQAPVSGEAAYGEHCASCHRTPARVMRRYLDMPPAERATALDRVLTDHYAPDPAQRAAIVAWLVQYRPR
jgi:mono/diheme cytochrome c family protein